MQGLERFKEQETKKGNKPIETDWLPLGENYGLSIAVWEQGITLQKRKKENNEWKTTDKIDLSHSVIERLFVRFPHYFELTKKKEDREDASNRS